MNGLCLAGDIETQEVAAESSWVPPLDHKSLLIIPDLPTLCRRCSFRVFLLSVAGVDSDCG